MARAVEGGARAGRGEPARPRTETLSGESSSGWRSPPPRAPAGAAAAGRADLRLDPVAGDELIWTLRQLNEEWGTAVVVAEHRLERCLPPPTGYNRDRGRRRGLRQAAAAFLDWAAGGDLATPVARMFSLAGIGPPPASVRAARTALRDAGHGARAPAPAPSSRARAGRRSRSAGSGTRGRERPRGPSRRWISELRPGSAAGL